MSIEGADYPILIDGYGRQFVKVPVEDFVRMEVEREAATPPWDVPPEAIEWARELVRQGYRDEHVVTFTEDGYGLEHPIRCRPNLTGCILNEWLRTQMAPDREPGRYIMEWTDNGPEYARLAQQDGTGEEQH